MTYEDIVVERVGEALEITLNRPEKLNAIREQTAAEIMHAMEEVEMDRSIVAVILQGSEKAFCTGTDTSGFQYSPGSLFDVYRARTAHAQNRNDAAVRAGLYQADHHGH